MMDIKLNTLRSGFDYKTCFVAPQVTATVDDSLRILTMSQLDLTGSDVFDGSFCAYSKDHGESWSELVKPEMFSRKANNFGGTSCYEIFTKRHRKSDRILGFCSQVNYTPENVVDHEYPRGIALTVLDAKSLTWSEPCEIMVPDEIRLDFAQMAAQHIELEDGDLLLPLAICKFPEHVSSVYTARVRINGEKAEIVEYGKPLDQVKQPRGLYEPSLIKFKERYFMALRNDITGYVSISDDGLNYADPVPLCFDNGELLGNYNTQQRWVRNGDDELYLIYTRRNAENDNVFRHRGPVMIARMDTSTLRVIRDSERILIPNRGARMGNFMATEVTPDRSWFTVAEWMQNDDVGYGRKGAEYCASLGSDNSVFLADITWQ